MNFLLFEESHRCRIICIFGIVRYCTIMAKNTFILLLYIRKSFYLSLNCLTTAANASGLTPHSHKLIKIEIVSLSNPVLSNSDNLWIAIYICIYKVKKKMKKHYKWMRKKKKKWEKTYHLKNSKLLSVLHDL